MIGNYRDVIIAPVITEKSAKIAEKGNKIVFKVKNDANKIQIKQAVEKIFGVKVLRVIQLTLNQNIKELDVMQGLLVVTKKQL